MSISGAGILITELKRIAHNDSFLDKKWERIVGFVRLVCAGWRYAYPAYKLCYP